MPNIQYQLLGALPQGSKCNQLRMLGEEIQGWLYTWALEKTFGNLKKPQQSES